MYIDNENYKKISAILLKIGIPQSKIYPNASFQLDLNFTDFDWCLLLNKIELLFKMEIKDEDLIYSETIGDLFNNIIPSE